MDLEQLLANIREAHDATKRDIEALERQREGAEGLDVAAVSLRLIAAEAVEATLGRILGETRSLSW